MAIRELYVAGYRSIRKLRVELGRVNVLVGPNGCGKSNLYQSMYLLASAAHGDLARAFAEEGGLPSALWAGKIRPTSKHAPVRMSLRVTTDDIEYLLQCGPPPMSRMTMFSLDPEIKEESLHVLSGHKRVNMMEREGGSVWLRNSEGARVSYPLALSDSESVLSQMSEPHLYPQLAATAAELRSWRFYHHFRTDSEAPARHPQVGVRTPVLDAEGKDLAAALQTIREIGDADQLDVAIEASFPGSKLEIYDVSGRFGLTLATPGIKRPFEARELSDGTLRYLCLLAALLSPRPPSVLALNEPETSLHPDLLQPLAKLISDASASSQMWITTHSAILAEAIEDYSGQPSIRLEKIDGETLVAGAGLLESGTLPIHAARKYIE